MGTVQMKSEDLQWQHIKVQVLKACNFSVATLMCIMGQFTITTEDWAFELKGCRKVLSTLQIKKVNDADILEKVDS